MKYAAEKKSNTGIVGICRDFISSQIDSFNEFYSDAKASFRDFNMKNKSVQYGIKIVVATFLALTAAFWMELPNPNWSAWTACTVMLPNIAASVKKASHRMIGTWLCMFISLLFYGLFFNNDIYFSIALFLYVTYLTYKRAVGGYNYYFWWILVDVTIVISFPTLTGSPDEAVYTAFYRAMNITNGIFWSFIVNFFLWPNYIQDTLHGAAKKVRKNYHSFLSAVFDGFSKNEFNRVDLEKMYKELNGTFVKLKDVLYFSDSERKFNKKDEVTIDLNIGELEFQLYSAWRFFEQAASAPSEYHKFYSGSFSSILDKLEKLIDALQRADMEAFNDISKDIDKEFSEINASYENDANKIYYPKQECFLVVEAITMLNSFYLNLRESQKNKSTSRIYQTTETLIEKYTYWKEGFFLGIHYKFDSLMMKHAIKSGLCVITIIWITFAMRLDMDFSVMSGFAAILFMRPKFTDKYDIFFILIFSTVLNLVVTLTYIMFFGDSTLFLYIFTLIIAFICFFLKHACPKPIMWYFAIWFLNCYTAGQLEVSDLSATLSVWPPLTLFSLTVIGIILVYLFNNLIWHYKEDEDYKQKLLAVNQLFGDVESNFAAYLQNRQNYFEGYAGFSKLLSQVTGLAEAGKISKEEKDYYIKTFNSLKWIFFELRALFVSDKETFAELYSLNRDFFDMLVKEVSTIRVFESSSSENDVHKSALNEIERRFSEIKDSFAAHKKPQDMSRYVHKFSICARLISLIRTINLKGNYEGAEQPF